MRVALAQLVKSFVRMPLVFSIATIGLASSCASSQPNDRLAAQKPVSSNEVIYKLPENNPTGNLQVHFFGIENFQQADNGTKTRALHMILAASNFVVNGEWEIDAKDLFVSFPNGMRVQPISAIPATMRIQPGGHVGMDLYFPLPKGLVSSNRRHVFDLHWRVKAIDQYYARTTTFALVRSPERQPDWNLYNPFAGFMFGPTAGLFD